MQTQTHSTHVPLRICSRSLRLHGTPRKERAREHDPRRGKCAENYTYNKDEIAAAAAEGGCWKLDALSNKNLHGCLLGEYCVEREARMQNQK